MSPARYFMLIVRRQERAIRNEERRYRHACEIGYQRAMDKVVEKFLSGQQATVEDLRMLNYWALRQEEIVRYPRRVRKPV